MIVGRLAREVRSSLSIENLGSFDPSDGSIPAPGEDSTVASGAFVNERSAMRTSAVWACTSLISNTIATLPYGVFHSEDRNGTSVRIPDPTPQVLADPHPEMDPVDWWTRILMSLLLRGNAFGYITATTRDGWPTEIIPLHPDLCRPMRNPTTGAIEYHVATGKTELAWPRGPIWHVRGLTLPGWIQGLSPIGCARQGIGLALSAEEFGARFFGDSAQPSGALSVKDDIPDTPAGNLKAKRIIKRWRATHGRRRLPALLTNGATWQALTINPNEAQFLETRQFQLSDIARFYLVPPHMIGDVDRSTSWGTGIEQQGIGFVTYTCGTWLVRLEQAVRRILPDPQYMRFNVNGLQRGDYKTRHEGYALARMWGLKTANQIATLEDEPPIEGGDVLLQPINYRDASLANIGERAKAASYLALAGWDPADIAIACDLPPMKHTGKVHGAPPPDDNSGDPNADPTANDPNADPGAAP